MSRTSFKGRFQQFNVTCMCLRWVLCMCMRCVLCMCLRCPPKPALVHCSISAAQIKLLEVWKAVNVPGYAIVLEPYNQTRPSNTHDLRTQANRIFNDSAKLKIAEQSFSIDAGKVWNRAPESVTKAPTLYMAKRAIRTLVKSFPVWTGYKITTIRKMAPSVSQQTIKWCQKIFYSCYDNFQ